jgi:hypothetical protein
MFRGIFIGLALTCLVTEHPHSHLTFRSFWLGGAVGKLVAVVAETGTTGLALADTVPLPPP